MARRERGLIRMIFNDFIASFIPKRRVRKLVGEDFYGTKYFETSPNEGSKKTSRDFQPVNKDDFTQEMPAEWEAWLRYRRKEPPTKEEVEKNYEMILLKRKNAAELTEMYTVKKVESLPIKSSPQTTPGGFPVYEEYLEYGSKDSKKEKDQ